MCDEAFHALIAAKQEESVESMTTIDCEECGGLGEIRVTGSEYGRHAPDGTFLICRVCDGTGEELA